MARAESGAPQILVYSGEADDPGLGQEVAVERLRGGLMRGNLTVFEEDGLGKVVRPGEAGGAVALGSAAGGDDVRALAVRWHNGRRRRPFREAVDLMEVHDFRGSPLEAASSLLWYLQELVQAGETPTSRRHGWVQVAGVPVGDRSVHEHSCIARVLE